jgi:MFS family permease
MEAIKQSLYGLNLAPYFFGTLAFVVIFALAMRKRVRSMHPRQLWILPAFIWIIAAVTLANALPQTGTQVVAFVVLVVTGLGVGVLLCLSDSLKHDPVTDTFSHRISLLSAGAASLIVALLIGYNPSNFWPGAVFIAGLVTGHSICLWRWAEYLRQAPEISHPGM